MLKRLDIILTLIMALSLTVAMLWPLDNSPLMPEGSDKILHILTFAALAFPLARTRRFGIIPVLFGASAFGGMIELLQPSFNRNSDFNDWLADTTGVSLGILCGAIYQKLSKL